ncbi:hypothetical protein IQ276_038285 [Desmonostoc muscorum LEGE 12446]|uniref:Uncharacterized protein n=1 Tax=Desmonostoc muscorum LEGE 12446 TaxID=1828758 RepID=A0A8J7A9S9_DESMC|nr:hypothetical protein [Desmonostoc muscorum]MCF2152141.1 hypothetical protein [Desmonostoc muscorum LEGE 12446]
MLTDIAQQTDNQKSPSIIFFLPNKRPKPGVCGEFPTTSSKAEIALARHLVKIGAAELALYVELLTKLLIL